jgi:hypothetical protein
VPRPGLNMYSMYYTEIEKEVIDLVKLLYKWLLKDKHILEELVGDNTLIISELDTISWIVNLRGKSIDYNPIFYTYLVVNKRNIFYRGKKMQINGYVDLSHLKKLGGWNSREILIM